MADFGHNARRQLVLKLKWIPKVVFRASWRKHAAEWNALTDEAERQGVVRRRFRRIPWPVLYPEMIASPDDLQLAEVRLWVQTSVHCKLDSFEGVLGRWRELAQVMRGSDEDVRRGVMKVNAYLNEFIPGRRRESYVLTSEWCESPATSPNTSALVLEWCEALEPEQQNEEAVEIKPLRVTGDSAPYTSTE